MTIFERISKNRLLLMGLAILWVQPGHLTFQIPTTYAWLPLNFLKSIGYGGVDIFLFLSGIGLYCSLARRPAALPFYGRRLSRILPAYLPAIAVWIVIFLCLDTMSLLEALGNIFVFGWWFDLLRQLNWYAQAIFLFYLIAPFLARIVCAKEHRARNAALLFAAALLPGLCAMFGRHVFDLLGDHHKLQTLARPLFSPDHLIAFSRLPIFLLGLYFGRALIEQRASSRKLSAALYACMAAGLVALAFFWRKLPELTLWNYGLWWYPFLLITPGLCLLASVVSDALRQSFLRPLITGFERMGEASYEIYLVHFILLQLLDWVFPINVWTKLLLIVFSVAIGLLYACLIRRARGLCARLRVQKG